MTQSHDNGYAKADGGQVNKARPRSRSAWSASSLLALSDRAAVIAGANSTHPKRFARSVAALSFFALCELTPAALAQLSPSGAVLARSYSGQFLVRSTPGPAASLRVSSLETNRHFIRLDPTLLPVSCERIRQLLWRELGATDPWRGRIFLDLYPTGSGDDAITITSEQFQDGWQYRLELPRLVERSHYVRGVVQVLLLELANRNAGAHSAEIPLWLTEGLTQQLLASSETEILLPPPRINPGGLTLTSTNYSAHKENPLGQAHGQLAARPALTFQQLSWPGPDDLTGSPAELYRSCAQLFVNDLLHLPEGRTCFRAMLAQLPQHYNWQFAFLVAFKHYFQRPLDIEKWWALEVVHFTGRDLAQTWPVDQSWQKLDEVIRSRVQVRTGTNELPLAAEVTLQSIIRQWDQLRQTQALQAKLDELQMLRLRLAPKFVSLADGYRQALQFYLQNQHQGGIMLPFRKQALRRHALEETLRQLDALDSQRLSLRPEPTVSSAVEADSRGVAPP